jgi:hypothetical protein
MAQLKTHWFDDCTAIPVEKVNGAWVRKLPPGRMVGSLYEVTCGACKGRIVERIRAADWSTATDAEIKFLMSFATP